jgi:hypothetical protein
MRVRWFQRSDLRCPRLSDTGGKRARMADASGQNSTRPHGWGSLPGRYRAKCPPGVSSSRLSPASDLRLP